MTKTSFLIYTQLVWNLGIFRYSKNKEICIVVAENEEIIEKLFTYLKMMPTKLLTREKIYVYSCFLGSHSTVACSPFCRKSVNLDHFSQHTGHNLMAN